MADDRISRFQELLRKASVELAARNPTHIDTGELQPTANVVDGNDVRPDYLWLIGPGERLAYRCRFDPLRLERLDELPTASDLGLTADPGRQLPPPRLLA